MNDQFIPSEVHHNLPQPDYRAFIGRKREIDVILRLLRPYPASRHYLIAIEGIGGIGKSALALEVAHQCQRDQDASVPEERFDAIIWVSAKQTVLTAQGITPHAQSLRTLKDIYITISITLGREDILRAPAQEQDELVRQALAQRRTLLIVDNLESFNDEGVMAFLRELPAPTKAIMTTRRRLFDGAYPIRLAGMSWDDAKTLIKLECQTRALTLTDEQIRKLYDFTGGLPLALIWSIAQIGFGYSVDSVLERLNKPTDSSLLRFVYENAVAHIRGTDAHKLLMALALYEDDATRETIGFLAGLGDDVLSRDEGLAILEQLSLVNRSGTDFSLMPLARFFVRSELSDPYFQRLAEAEWSSKNVETRMNQFERTWNLVSEKPSDSWPDSHLTRFEVFSRQFQESINPNNCVSISEPSFITSGEFIVYNIDAKYPFRDTLLPSSLPLVFFVGEKLTDHNVQRLIHTLRQAMDPHPRTQLALFVAPFLEDLQDSRSFCRDRVRTVFGFDIVIASRMQLQQIFVDAEPDRALRQAIISDVSLLSISPFIITGLTPDNMFFGRESELRLIVERCDSVSYAIVGGRRVGKSSLLSRLHRIRLPNAGFRTIYHDCSITPTYDLFLSAPIYNWRPEPPVNAPMTFGDLLQSPSDDRPLILILDEADKLIPADRAINWRLFSAFRALVNSGRAQVILSGERTLREALQDSSSPLFNFPNEMLIGRLDFHAVEDLVIRPMKQLEIKLENEKAIVDRIWSFTSGHPNVVQRLCHRLMERLDKEDIRRITSEDVIAITESIRFQREDFLSTYWEAATPLERIVSLVMADDKDVRNLSAVRQALAERCGMHPKARDIDSALQRLVDLRSILERAPNGYAFAVEAFPRVVAGTITLNDMLETLSEEYEEQGE